MQEVLVNRLGPGSMVRLNDRLDMTLDVYGDVKQQQQQPSGGLIHEEAVGFV